MESKESREHPGNGWHNELSPDMDDSHNHSREPLEEIRLWDIRIAEIRGGFQNLTQTVTPQARNWFEENDPAWQEKMKAAGTALESHRQDIDKFLNTPGSHVEELISELEQDLARARVELGSRTAAGRAKSSRLFTRLARYLGVLRGGKQRS